ncbi:MAG TPA: ABC transporter permease [Gemmatimonadaceae bacterium]|nr:ABC transporter permease [Gemmatimonadaceae bacterium]
MSWFHRLANTLRSRALARDLDREVAFHIAEREDDLAAHGMSPDQAALEARRRFGNRTILTERTRDRDVLAWLESVFADTRYAARALVANPGFATVAILSLALGLGANTAIFSLTNALVLRSLPVRDPGHLMMVTSGDKHPKDPSATGTPFLTNPMWEEIRDHTHIFAGAFAYSSRIFDLSKGGMVRRAGGAVVSGAFFNVLGVRSVAGRVLGVGDDAPGCGGVAVVSGGFAAREFGGAAAAVGKVLSLDGHPMEIVGVSDPRFSGIEVGRRADVFVPLCAVDLLDGPGTLAQRSRWYLQVVGRAPTGLTEAAVGARIAAASATILDATVPGNWSNSNKTDYLDRTFTVIPAAAGFSELRRQYEHPLWLLLAAVGVVLLIACVNIANLLLARAAGRQREMAIRLSLGAGRGRIIRQLLTESVLLALIGAALGALFARWADSLVVGWISQRQNPASLDLSLDWRVLGFAVGVALVTATLFGVIPALRATRVDPQAAMKAGGRGVAGGRRQRMSRPLVAAQLALSLALVTGAGLLVTSFRNLGEVKPGFRPDGVMLVQADFSNAGSKDRLPAMKRDVLDQLRAVPGVQSASASVLTSMSGMGWNDLILIPGFTGHSIDDSLANFNEVSAGFFATTGTKLIAGRAFTPEDGGRSDVVAIVSRTMARHFFGTDNALGRSFRTPVADSSTPPYEIVGVVEDTKYASLDERTGPIVYLPLGSKLGLKDIPAVSYELRTNLPVDAILPSVRDAVSRVSPAIQLDATTFSAQIAATLSRPRLLAILSSFFGGLALVLAVIGLYGTLAYDVARRRNEIGVRLALGAAWRDVVRLVLGDAGRVVVAGIIVGVGLALTSARFVRSFLYGVGPQDVSTLVGAILVLCATALIATVVPAWRAARTNPTDALREE